MNDAETVARLAREAAEVPHIVKTGSGEEFLVWPGTMSQQKLTPRDHHGNLLEKPAIVAQAPVFLDTPSFCDFVNRFKTQTTAVFANMQKGTFEAVFDYHANSVTPDRCDSRAFLTLQFSEEWNRWTKNDGNMVAQDEFARFLEENNPEITEPAGADVLDVARNLSARRNVVFNRAVRLDNGDERFEYSEETTAQSKSGQGIDVPSRFKIAIPVFLGEPKVEITCMLRWRIAEKALRLGYEMHRRTFVQMAVFNLIMTTIREKTGVDVFSGMRLANPDMVARR